MDGRLGFFEFLNLYSTILAEMNLKENREQSAHNDVQKANDKQAKNILEELGRKFDEIEYKLDHQDAILTQILEEIRRQS